VILYFSVASHIVCHSSKSTPSSEACSFDPLFRRCIPPRLSRQQIHAIVRSLQLCSSASAFHPAASVTAANSHHRQEPAVVIQYFSVASHIVCQSSKYTASSESFSCVLVFQRCIPHRLSQQQIHTIFRSLQLCSSTSALHPAASVTAA
jgi:hypothetical protein